MNESNRPGASEEGGNQRQGHPCGANCGCGHGSGDGLKGYGTFAILIGIFFGFMYPMVFQWIFHKLFGAAFPKITDNGTGEEVPFIKSMFFWPNVGPALFAAASVLEGIALVVKPRRVLIGAALIVTAGMTLFNAGYLFYTFNQAFAPVSFLAAVFGGYSVMTLLQMMSTKAGHGGHADGCGSGDCHCGH